jgi:hypothetical protein
VTPTNKDRKEVEEELRPEPHGEAAWLVWAESTVPYIIQQQTVATSGWVTHVTGVRMWAIRKKRKSYSCCGDICRSGQRCTSLSCLLINIVDL